MLRQLEAECRTHIKCEQQMKLHIECLQDKLDETADQIELLEAVEKRAASVTEEFESLKLLAKQMEKELKMHKAGAKLKDEEIVSLTEEKQRLDA